VTSGDAGPADGASGRKSPAESDAGTSVSTGGAGSEELELLHDEVELLRQQNEALRRAEEANARKGWRPRLRGIFSWVLLVVACLLAIISVVVAFGHNQLLNTDTYVSTVAPLASNPAIQTAAATRVSDALVKETNLQKRIQDALPKRASFLADPIANEVKSATYAVTLKLVQSDQFQTFWVGANRVAHKQLVNLLTGSTQGAVSTNDGKITVDLGQVETEAKQALDARGITVFNKVSVAKGRQLVLFQSDQLSKYQRLVRFFNKLYVALPIITLLLFAASVILTRDRRRGLIRAAVGLVLSMGLILVVVSVARNQYLSGLSPSQSKPASTAVIDTVSAPLQDITRTVLIVAAVIALVAIVAGLSFVRRWVSERRRPDWLTGGPVHDFVAAHRKGLQWTVLAVGLLILVLWSKPTALVAVIVVLITLFVIGLVGVFSRLTPNDSPPSVGPGDTAGSVGPGSDDPAGSGQPAGIAAGSAASDAATSGSATSD
jgi:hypothetical protein